MSMMFEVMNITFYIYIYIYIYIILFATTRGEGEFKPTDQVMSLGYKAHGEMIKSN